MVATSPIYGLPLPDASGTDQVPADLLSLVAAAEPLFVGQFADTATRDTQITDPQPGMVAWIVALGYHTTFVNATTGWAILFNSANTGKALYQADSVSGVSIPSSGGALGIATVTVPAVPYRTLHTINASTVLVPTTSDYGQLEIHKDGTTLRTWRGSTANQSPSGSAWAVVPANTGTGYQSVLSSDGSSANTSNTGLTWLQVKVEPF